MTENGEQPLILVADDDPDILSLVAFRLERSGYDVVTASDGEEALRLAVERTPDLAVLDVMMPKVDGWEALRRLRTESNVPVIMLTARADDVDKVVGLELGADDYVTKPFNPRELVARVKAVLRRSQGMGSADPLVEVGNLSIDVARREVRVCGALVSLQNREFDLLLELARNPGRVLTRDALLTHVWDYAYTGNSRTVDVHVTWLREKLTGSGLEIHSVRGLGYKLVVLKGASETRGSTLGSDSYAMARPI